MGRGEKRILKGGMRGLRGETVRKLEDCLVATVALRHGATLLHRDHDFEVIARHAPLRVMG